MSVSVGFIRKCLIVAPFLLEKLLSLIYRSNQGLLIQLIPAKLGIRLIMVSGKKVRDTVLITNISEPITRSSFKESPAKTQYFRVGMNSFINYVFESHLDTSA